MPRAMNLQDHYLSQLQVRSIPVTVFLMNGVQLRGVVRGFDAFTVLMDNNGTDNLIYKHAISTIIPHEKVQR